MFCVLKYTCRVLVRAETFLRKQFPFSTELIRVGKYAELDMKCLAESLDKINIGGNTRSNPELFKQHIDNGNVTLISAMDQENNGAPVAEASSSKEQTPVETLELGEATAGAVGGGQSESLTEKMQEVVKDKDELLPGVIVQPSLKCPHLDNVAPVPEQGIDGNSCCIDCNNKGENQICLACGTENEEAVQCGFLVDQINTIPYQKAVTRGEVPFCAFSPISTEHLYLLRIQNCSDSTRHMLVPASKDDVVTLPGALNSIDDRDESSNDNLNFRVAIVAIARQIYSPEEKQLVVSVDPPLKKDKDKISRVKFLTLDKFADFAFLGFDGDVSEFAKSEDSKATATTVNKEKSQVHEDSMAKMTSSPPPAVQKEKSPPRAPARRGGRGGRRKASRKSPPMHSSPSCNLPPQMIRNHHFSFESLPPILPPPEILNDYNPTFLKMEESEDHSYHILPQMFMPPMSNPMTYTHEDVVVDIPMPISEITVSTSEPGMEANVEHTNHDIITIALDQLIPMTSGDPFSTVPTQSQRASRGGRRPGRKPGRKSTKEKEQRDPDENSVVERNTFGGEGIVPKRRGRPPKNRVVMQIASEENDNAQLGTDDYETQVLGKRVKLQVYD